MVCILIYYCTSETIVYTSYARYFRYILFGTSRKKTSESRSAIMCCRKAPRSSVIPGLLLKAKDLFSFLFENSQY